MGNKSIFSVMVYYRPQRSWGKIMLFTRVCDSVHRRRGLSATLHAGIHPLAQCMLGDTVNEWAVCILLECNLVHTVWERDWNQYREQD